MSNGFCYFVRFVSSLLISTSMQKEKISTRGKQYSYSSLPTMFSSLQCKSNNVQWNKCKTNSNWLPCSKSQVVGLTWGLPLWLPQPWLNELSFDPEVTNLPIRTNERCNKLFDILLLDTDFPKNWDKQTKKKNLTITILEQKILKAEWTF